jgi:hypothetical protein
MKPRTIKIEAGAPTPVQVETQPQVAEHKQAA